MNIPSQFIRFFPEPESVFTGDIDKHRQHFLPICSIDSRILYPEAKPMWLHFVQPADIYEYWIGMETEEYYDGLNFMDSFCFDVNSEGKYCFNGDWRIFESENTVPEAIWQQAKKTAQEKNIDLYKALPPNWGNLASGRLAEAIRVNHDFYQLMKRFYAIYQRLPFCDYQAYEMIELQKQSVEESLPKLIALEQEYERAHPDEKPKPLFEDIAGKSADMQETMQKKGVSEVWQLFQEEFYNLFDTPKRHDGRVFDYVGSLCGHDFQAHGCDELYLFFDPISQKAVIRLVYS